MPTYMKYIFLGSLVAILALTGCNTSEEHPGYIYFPDMTYSQAYETMTPNPVAADSQTQQLPIAGTIPRGFEPFHYENNISEYARAATELTNPLEATEKNIEEGKYFYDIYCAICHGAKGEGNGHIVQREKFPPPPSYFNDYMLNLEDGKMFYSIHFGKGLMGSYASQLTQKERWKVILYINKMQRDFTGEGDAPADTSAAPADTSMAGATAMINSTQNVSQ